MSAYTLSELNQACCHGNMEKVKTIIESGFDINEVFPFGTDLTLADTENSIGLLFDANNSYFSTGKQVLSGVAVEGIFDETFDETFE